jgi:hypothetical protein
MAARDCVTSERSSHRYTASARVRCTYIVDTESVVPKYATGAATTQISQLRKPIFLTSILTLSTHWTTLHYSSCFMLCVVLELSRLEAMILIR